MDDLLDLKTKKFGIYQNLSITYYPYPIWLWRFDAKLIYGLKVSIDSYTYQRARYLELVGIALVKLRVTIAGKALLDAIDGTEHTLEILPFFDFSLYPVLGFPPTGYNATTAGRSGFAADAMIKFSPQMWQGGGGEEGTSVPTGAGSQADEVLFHELIHGLRYLEGVTNDEEAVDENYDSGEEFIAVTLTNIYIAEKTKNSPLRRSHHDFKAMPHPNDFLKNPQYKHLVRNFKIVQKDFAKALAASPAWWKPVRDLGE